MSEPRDLPRYVYRKGKRGFLYFERRPRFIARLPNMGDPAFGAAYALALETSHKMKVSPAPPVMRSPAGHPLFRELERGARSRAKKRGVPFLLPPGWMAATYTRQGGRCAISGVPMNKTRAKHDPFAPSIDRVNPQLGYTPENCQLVCYAVNCGKNQFDLPTYLFFCAKVSRGAVKRKKDKM